MKSYGMTIQMKPLQQYFCMVPFVFQYFTKCNLRFFLNFDFWHSWELIKGLKGKVDTGRFHVSSCFTPLS